jgi:hypothetical protein
MLAIKVMFRKIGELMRKNIEFYTNGVVKLEASSKISEKCDAFPVLIWSIGLAGIFSILIIALCVFVYIFLNHDSGKSVGSILPVFLTNGLFHVFALGTPLLFMVTFGLMMPTNGMSEYYMVHAIQLLRFGTATYSAYRGYGSYPVFAEPSPYYEDLIQTLQQNPQWTVEKAKAYIYRKITDTFADGKPPLRPKDHPFIEAAADGVRWKQIRVPSLQAVVYWVWMPLVIFGAVMGLFAIYRMLQTYVRITATDSPFSNFYIAMILIYVTFLIGIYVAISLTSHYHPEFCKNIQGIRIVSSSLEDVDLSTMDVASATLPLLQTNSVLPLFEGN